MTRALYTMYPKPGAWKRHGLEITAGIIAADRGMAWAYWNFEANPMVQQLGIGPWIGLSAAVIALVYWIWEVEDHKDIPAVRGVMALIAFMHLLAILSNVTVVA